MIDDDIVRAMHIIYSQKHRTKGQRTFRVTTLHRTASINEYSGRYSVMPPLFYLPELENIKYQSKTNHQGGDLAMPNAKGYQIWFDERTNDTFRMYEELVEDGMAKETARMVLPLSSYTTFYWKINLHNLLHFLTLRTEAHSQWEIREYANVLAGYARKIVPLVYEAWVDYTVEGASFSNAELHLLKQMLTIKDGGVYPDANCYHKAEDLKYILPNARERQEFLDKLTPKEPVDFTLDESKLITPAQAQERFNVH